MSTFVDTNVLIRHLTGDPPDMAAAATRFLAEADDLLVVDLVIAEVVYVLESFLPGGTGTGRGIDPKHRGFRRDPRSG